MSNDAMMYNVKVAVYNAKKRVWVEGDTVNVDRIKNKKKQPILITEVYIPHARDHCECEREVIIPTR
jgi:hypothetical protein